MKRGIFRRQSIDICIEHRVLATPITPAALPFAPGEDMVVATPKSEATLGEYQFLFVVGEYVGDDSSRANLLFARSDWKHLYRIDSVTTVEPFSLAELVSAAGDRGAEVEYRYKGQTQHHRIIRTIAPEDEPLWRGFIRPATEPTTSAASVLEGNASLAATREAHQMTESEIVVRLRRMNAQNRRLAKGRSYRPGKSQQRNRAFSSLLKALYDGQCQICGERVTDPAGERYSAHVHHLQPWDGDRSDRLDNVICVCPNDHARLELGACRWTANGLEIWQDEDWILSTLAFDKHLLVALTAAPATGPVVGGPS